MLLDPILLIGFITFLGYFSLLLFEKKKVSQIITLILIGIIVGPVLNLVDVSEGSVIREISPLLASLALILLLFDGGLNLNIIRTAKEFPKAFLFTIFVFLLSSFGTAYIMEYLFLWPFLDGLLLGVILGGTSSAVVITIVEQANIKQNLKTFLTLESTITDVLVVIISYLLISYISGDFFNINVSIVYLTSAFSTAIVIGVISALFWFHMLNKLEEKTFSYMLTIAFALVIYSISNFLGGNGNFAVFVFALVLGNIKEFGGVIKLFSEDKAQTLYLDRKIRTFQEEITFFIRTFFFVYMGLILPTSLLNFKVIAIVVLLSFFFLFVRNILVVLFFRSETREDKFLISTSLGRGLAAAVVASLAISEGIEIPGFIEIIIGVILLTNIITSFGVFAHFKVTEGKEGKTTPS